MAAGNYYRGTPTGGVDLGTPTLYSVQSVQISENAELLEDMGDGGVYVHHTALNSAKPQITIETWDFKTLAGIKAGDTFTGITMAFDGFGGASDTGTLTIASATVLSSDSNGSAGDKRVGTLVLLATASDGVTNPLSWAFA